MDLATITNIRDYRDNIRNKINNISKSNLNSSTTYGGENEYVYKGLIGGLDCLMTDISALTKAPKKFIALSTHSERNNIVQYLSRIDTYFDTPPNYIPQFEALKILMRSYNVRNWSERQLEFEEELAETLKIKQKLQVELAEIQSIKKAIEENNTEIDSYFESKNEKLEEIEQALLAIIQKKDDLIEQSETLESINESVLEIKENAIESLEEIKTSLTESKSNEKLITSFANKVQEREKRLTELEQSTEENNKKLREYEVERQGILNEANELIDSAKKALNYKTAEGISASFQEHYILSKNKWLVAGWIVGAIICLLGTIGLGIWILENSVTSIGIILGRVSMLPLPIIGAIFCANQYTKQKNIIEDYAYKMVLSKAIVGFSEQLKKNSTGDKEEYVHYIKTALEEIHKDPLRKREKSKEDKTDLPNLSSLVEFAEKIIKLSKIEN